jgi:hypothetical protein
MINYSKVCLMIKLITYKTMVYKFWRYDKKKRIH